MSGMKNKNDWGYMTFGTERFHWKFGEIIEITPSNRKKNILTLKFERESLLNFVNNKLKKPKNTVIGVLPPEFVTQAIKFAINRGWNPKKTVGEFKFKYVQNEFVKP